MKQMALLVLVLLAGFASAAFTPSQALADESVLPGGIPETISLLDVTPLYPEPDDSAETWAALSPQDVRVIRTQYGDNGYANASGHTWILIHTSWLGDRWIKVENNKLGVIKPINLGINLAVETPLYDRPYQETANGGKLPPQTVHAKAEFVSPSGFYALQIETSWLGDKWLIQPEIINEEPANLNFPDAVSPDYGNLMKVANIRVVELAGRTFVQGHLVLQKEAWEVGRFHPGTGEIPVSGKLTFWNLSGDVIAKVPYAVTGKVGESASADLFLPVQADLSVRALVTLQDTIPTYIGLPVPPLLNLTDPEGKVAAGILRHHTTGDYSIANAWISGKLPGSHDYHLTLTFYGEGDRILGTSHVHQRLNGPIPSDQAGTEGGGSSYLIDVMGKGDWTDYRRVSIHVDQVSEE